MKSILIYYAQRGHIFAKQSLYKETDLLLKSIANQAYRKYPYIFSIDELLQVGKNVFYESVKKYSFNKKATFATYFSLMYRYEIAKIVRQSFTNRSIITTFSIKKDYSEFNDNILADNRKSQVNTIFEKDLYARIIKNLKPQDQEIIDLWSKGYSYQEIANQYDKQLKWADNRIARILHFLRKCVSNGLIK